MTPIASVAFCRRRLCVTLYKNLICLLPPTKEEINAFARTALVCLSVCLLERLIKNACIDLDEMLRVDRYSLTHSLLRLTS